MPAFASVEGFVARSNNGSFYQYSYTELFDSCALSLFGSQNGIYEEFKAKKPVAMLSSENGYVDYTDIIMGPLTHLSRKDSWHDRENEITVSL